MPPMLVTVILHHPGPIKFGHQRRVLQAHGLQHGTRTQHQIVSLLMQRVSLHVDGLLQPPDPDKSGNQHDAQQNRCGVLSAHFRFRREKIAVAAANTMVQYKAAYAVFCTISAEGMARPWAAAAMTSKFSKLGSR